MSFGHPIKFENMPEDIQHLVGKRHFVEAYGEGGPTGELWVITTNDELDPGEVAALAHLEAIIHIGEKGLTYGFPPFNKISAVPDWIHGWYKELE